jgi:hypothetical protein
LSSERGNEKRNRKKRRSSGTYSNGLLNTGSGGIFGSGIGTDDRWMFGASLYVSAEPDGFICNG